MNVNIIDTEKYQPARQNMKLTRQQTSYSGSTFVFSREKSHNSKYLSAHTPLGQIRFNT
jgi:hypothetical protein